MLSICSHCQTPRNYAPLQPGSFLFPLLYLAVKSPSVARWIDDGRGVVRYSCNARNFRQRPGGRPRPPSGSAAAVVVAAIVCGPRRGVNQNRTVNFAVGATATRLDAINLTRACITPAGRQDACALFTCRMIDEQMTSPASSPTCEWERPLLGSEKSQRCLTKKSMHYLARK